MKICFFNRSYPPDQGSTGQLLSELAEDLVRRHGCEVTVVAGIPTSSAAPLERRPRWWAPVHEERLSGVRVLRAWGTSFPPRLFARRAANYLTYFFSACLAGLRVGRPDVVVSLTDPPVIGLAALFTARIRRARFVFLCQDIFPEAARLLEDFRSEWVNRRLDGIYRCLLRHADRVIALGETMRRRLIEVKGADPRKIVVIHNWADSASIVPGPKQNPFSERHRLSGSFVVMHSGNVGVSQNLETLIETAKLLEPHPEIVVAIVGDGIKRNDLERNAHSLGLTNVRFIPYQPKGLLSHSFASADLFVISLKKGLAGYIVPSKLYGVLAAGRPFIAAVEPECEAAEIASRFGCGLVVPPGDSKALAEGILSLYDDRERARRMGEEARRASSGFDRAKAVDAYRRLFGELNGGS